MTDAMPIHLELIDSERGVALATTGTPGWGRGVMIILFMEQGNLYHRLTDSTQLLNGSAAIRPCHRHRLATLRKAIESELAISNVSYKTGELSSVSFLAFPVSGGAAHVMPELTREQSNESSTSKLGEDFWFIRLFLSTY